MAISVSFIVVMERMVLILRRQGLPFAQHVDDVKELLDVLATSLHALVVALEARRVFDFVAHASRLARRVAMS